MRTDRVITVLAPSQKEIDAYPREYALLRQLEHTHTGQIRLEVSTCRGVKTKHNCQSVSNALSS